MDPQLLTRPDWTISCLQKHLSITVNVNIYVIFCLILLLKDKQKHAKLNKHHLVSSLLRILDRVVKLLQKVRV